MIYDRTALHYLACLADDRMYWIRRHFATGEPLPTLFEIDA